MYEIDNATIKLSEDTKVEQALRHYANVFRPETVRKLTVLGTMSGWHFRDILNKMGKTLQELDLSKVSIAKNTWITYYDDCPGLISISFPASIEELNPGMIGYFSNLLHIEIHPDHPEYIVENSIVFNRDKTELIRYPTGRKGEYVVPDTVVKIGNYAFSDCTGLTSVTIHPLVVSLGYNAFYNCTELLSVDMPKSLKYKKNRVFENCNKLPQFIESQNDSIKQGKIKQLQGTSAYDWIDNLMKNSKYPYKMNQEHKTKIQLSVKINDKQKLEIPIYLRHFQKTIPKLMDTIQQYETCIKENEITVFVENVIFDKRYWETEHLSKKNEK